MTDLHGVIWPRGTEVCPVCGQPSDGDCNHQPLPREDVIALGGVPIGGLTVEEACGRAGISFPNQFVNVKRGASNGK